LGTRVADAPVLDGDHALGVLSEAGVDSSEDYLALRRGHELPRLMAVELT
jgi:hypothetical protein